MLRLVLGEGLAWVGMGIAIGLIAALALTRLLNNLIWGVAPKDPLTLASGAALLFTVTLAAILIPAWRAMCVDPTIALRYE